MVKQRHVGRTVNTAVQGQVTGRIVTTHDLHPYIVAQYQNIMAYHWAEENAEEWPQFLTNYAPIGVNFKARRLPRTNVKPDATTQANAHPNANYVARPYACQNAGLTAEEDLAGVYQ